MASGIVREKYILCPYWARQGGSWIRCEGIVDGAMLTQSFPGEDVKRRHMEIFCCDAYTNCEIYRAVTEAKYQDE